MIRQLVNGSDPADWQQVEVLAWLYQFYISEKKDAVMARKSAVPTADIPAVTQLFTPHWIVRYLVENSLGRLWMQNRPQSKLIAHMPYYIADAANPNGMTASSNPNGIASSSPGLRGTSYPGSTTPPETNPNGVASVPPSPAGDDTRPEWRGSVLPHHAEAPAELSRPPDDEGNEHQVWFHRDSPPRDEQLE